MSKAIGVSEYQLTRTLPKKLKSDLPSIEEIGAELSEMSAKQRKAGTKRRGKAKTRGGK